MSDLIIAAYASPSAAFVAGENLAVLQQNAGVEPEDIVVVTRSAAGRVSVNHSVDLETGKPLGGGRWGAMIGLLFVDGRRPTGFGNGLAEKLHAAGLEAAFLTGVFHALDKGGAAAGLHVRLLGVDRVLGRLKQMQGNPEIFHARLSAAAEEALLDMQGLIPQRVLDQTSPDGVF